MKHCLLRSSALIVAVFLISATTGGCATRHATDPRQHFEVVGPIEIDVESFGGNVTVTADQRHRGAVVQIVRRAVHGHGRTQEARASLEEISHSAELLPGEHGQRLLVRTFTTHDEPYFQRADVHITAMEISNVRIKTRRGDVDVRAIEGSIDINTEGDVKILTNRAMRQPVTIITRDGDIDYRVRGESTGAFDCETLHGEINRRVRYGRFIAEPGSAHNRMRGRLNDGTNQIQLRTVYGDIRIAVVHNPEQVGSIIFE